MSLSQWLEKGVQKVVQVHGARGAEVADGDDTVLLAEGMKCD